MNLLFSEYACGYCYRWHANESIIASILPKDHGGWRTHIWQPAVRTRGNPGVVDVDKDLGVASWTSACGWGVSGGECVGGR